MSQCAILGLTSGDSPGTDEVEWLDMRLEERGVRRILLNAIAPPDLVITTDFIGAQGHNLSGLRAIFVRDLGLPTPHVPGPDGRLDPHASLAALKASREHLAGWNLLLEVLAARGTRVVNPVPTHEIHALKPWELATHANAEAKVPATLSGWPEAELLRAGKLPHSRSGSWIEKGLTGGRGYTESFDPATQGQRATEPDKVEAPTVARQVQERIEGVNVRAFVVGMRMIGAAANHTADPGEVDSRRGVKRIQRVKLPPEAECAAVDATRRLGMLFSAVDFMREEASGR